MKKIILLVLVLLISGMAAAQEGSIRPSPVVCIDCRDGAKADLVWHGELNATNTYGDVPLLGAIYVGGNISSIWMDLSPAVYRFPAGTIIILFLEDNRAFLLKENSLIFLGRYNNNSKIHIFPNKSDVEVWDIGMPDSVVIPGGYDSTEIHLNLSVNEFEIYARK